MSGFQYKPMGFDASNVVLHYFNSVQNSSGGSAPTIGAGGRNSTSALIFTVPTGSTNPLSRAIKTLPVNLATGFQPFAMIYNALPSSGEIIFLELRDAGTTQLDFRLQTDGRIRLTRAGTTLATSTFITAPNIYYHCEPGFTINDSTGALDFKINENSILAAPLTGIDTKNTANAYITEFALCAVLVGANILTAVTIKFDDVGTRDDSYSGDFRVREQLPTGTGDVDNGVPGGSAAQPDTRRSVDETPPNDDVDWAGLVNVGDKFLLTFAAISTSEEVLCVGLAERATKSAAGTGKYKSVVKIGGTEYLGAVEKAPSNGSWAYLEEVQMFSPATGGSTPYTAAEVNGAQFGAEKTA